MSNKHFTDPGKMSVLLITYVSQDKKKDGSMMLKVSQAYLVADHITVGEPHLAPSTATISLFAERSSQRIWYS
jgi:hypothetical protein